MQYLDSYQQWLANCTVTEKLELRAIALDEKEIKERFTYPLAFGTAGMRGVLGLGTFRMNLYTVKRATAGVADYIEGLGAEAMRRGVVISYDTRRMSFEFALAVARVLADRKINSFLFENVRPVPICSFTIGHLHAIAGIMITASHNPKEYNGYKVYGEDGAQMSPDATEKVVEFIEKRTYFGIGEAAVTTEERKDISGMNDAYINPYIKVIGKNVDEAYYDTISRLSLSPEAVKSEGKRLKIVYTPIHGSGWKPVTSILRRMNIPFDVVKEQQNPDPDFPTVKVPNPEQPDALLLGMKLANELASDVVIGTDPDCDRMGVAVRNAGEFVLLNGNQIGALLLDYILRRHSEIGDLPKNAAVVKTIVTTGLAKAIADSYSVACYDVLTGFKFIGEKIDEWGKSGEHTFLFGYEESFGYLAGTHAKDKDAVVSAMLFAEMVCYYKSIGVGIYERLQQLFDKFGFYTEKSLSLVFSGLDGMTVMANKMEQIRSLNITKVGDKKVLYISDYQKRETVYSDGNKTAITLPKSNVVYIALEGGNWVCVRPSGTEPKLKVYTSAVDKTKEDSEKLANALLSAAKSLLD